MIGEAISPSVTQTEAGMSDRWLIHRQPSCISFAILPSPVANPALRGVQSPRAEREIIFPFPGRPQRANETGIEAEATTDYVAV